MEACLRIAVIGYGNGGQAAALMLSRDGHRVEVFEQAPGSDPSGPASCCNR